VRISAIEVAGRIGSGVRVKKELKKLLSDKDTAVCLHAASALGMLGDSGGLNYAVEALETEEPSLRVMAVETLGNIKTAKSKKILLKLKKKEEAYLKTAVEESIKKLGR